MKCVIFKITAIVVFLYLPYINGQVIDSVPNNQPESFLINSFTTPDKFWSNYDFVPGTDVLYYDNFKEESSGEKPEKWNINTGDVSIATHENSKVIHFKTGDSTIIEPVFSTKNYLPSNNFTVEFDIYFDRYANQSITEYCVFFNDDITNRIQIRSYTPLKIETLGNQIPRIIKIFPYTNTQDFYGWHHIAIHYNFGRLKLYYDDKQIVNESIYNLRPKSISIFGKTYDFRENSDRKTFLKNFKIATGKSSIYSGIATKSKYTSNAILYDFAMPFFKSESSGEINRIFRFLRDNPNWNFNIIAPNDNTSDIPYNTEISKMRGESIKSVLVSLGINERRLTVLSKKDPQDIDTNANAETNFSHVEFVLRP